MQRDQAHPKRWVAFVAPQPDRLVDVPAAASLSEQSPKIERFCVLVEPACVLPACMDQHIGAVGHDLADLIDRCLAGVTSPFARFNRSQAPAVAIPIENRAAA